MSVFSAFLPVSFLCVHSSKEYDPHCLRIYNDNTIYSDIVAGIF